MTDFVSSYFDRTRALDLVGPARRSGANRSADRLRKNTKRLNSGCAVVLKRLKEGAS